MLVLSRKVGESILIGDKVTVTVVRIGPGSVGIGVEAPREMTILRPEVADRLDARSPHGEHAGEA
jgi:carbon storage regulator